MSERKERKTRVGVVASTAMDKTITVKIERRLAHPIYGKSMKRSKKLMAHDEANDCNVGDTVKIMETRPLSKRKRWRVVEVVDRAK